MLKIVAAFLLLHSCLAVNTSNVLFNEIFSYHYDTYEKADFAKQVVEKLQGSFEQWFFTIIFCEFSYFENRIVKYMETFNDGYPVLLLTACPIAGNKRIRPKINRHGSTSYVVSSNELSADVNEYVISALIRTGVWKPRSAVIFVVNVPVIVDSYFYYDMMNHFQLLWSRRITNSVLVVWCERLRIYSFNPFYNNIREVTEYRDISRLLKSQYNNLYGKEIRLSVFRKIYISDATGPLNCDNRVATTVMSYFNATCVPVPPRDKNTVGDLLDNGTATGVTADLIEGFTEMELNSRILKNSFYGYIDTTYPLVQDALCFVVKKSERQSTVSTTLRLMKTEVLIAFMLNVFLLTLIAVIAYKLENKFWGFNNKKSIWETVMDLMKCFLRQTVDITFLGPLFRTIVLVTMMYALVVNSVIDAILTSAITCPRNKPDINTMDELAESNLTLAVHGRDMDIFLSSLTPYYLNMFENRIEEFNDQKIKTALTQRQFQYAVLLRKSDASYVSRKPSNLKDGKPLFHIMQECPLPCFIVYGLEYGSPYLQRLNYLMHHLSQGGVLKHWVETEEFTLIKQKKDALDSDDAVDRKPLSMENLREVFYVLLGGILLSFISFALEFVSSAVHVSNLN